MLVDHCSYFELSVVRIFGRCGVNQQGNFVLSNNAQTVWGRGGGGLNGLCIVEDNKLE
jgi:hypothetical protein